jgi:hypothetical protein
MKVFVVFFIVLFMITGCSSFAKKELDRAEIDDLLVQHKYGSVLTKLDSIADSDSKSGALRKQVLDEAKDYEKERISKSRDLVTQNQFYGASKTLEDALHNFPQSTALKNEQSLLSDQREALIQRRLDELTLAYAHYLEKALVTHQQIAKWQVGSEQLSQQYMEVHNEAEDLAKHLVEIAEARQKQGSIQTDKVAEYYSTALKLSDTRSVKIANLVFVNSEKTKQAITKQTRRQRQADRQEKQIRDIKHSIKQKDFIKARNIFNNTKNFPVSEQLKELETLYQSALNKEVLKSYQKGIRLYSAEQYQLALKSWEKTLALDPEHEMARQNMRRVSRILEKIRQLQQKNN